eukprot:TRINITY_DN2434_c0_g1_i1.p1 TRINITY_DN2434_c0_g1~~TRINITY_DN2434_c0_g1_i1.p1  ORF type:complete len:379 (+),score=145.70 TRINITY_DN2434_c0_g1_i1:69-1205(+)
MERPGSGLTPTPRTKQAATPPIPSTPTTPSRDPNLASRLRVIDSLLDASRVSTTTRAEREKKRQADVERKLSVLEAEKDMDRKERSQGESFLRSEFDKRVLKIEAEIADLAGQIATEQIARKSEGSSFAQKFIMQVEERFVKAESLLSSLRRAFQGVETRFQGNVRDVESTVQTLEERLNKAVESIHIRLSQFDETWKGISKALVRIEHSVEQVSRNEREFESQIQERVNTKFAELAGKVESDQVEREKLLRNAQHIALRTKSLVEEGRDVWMKESDDRMREHVSKVKDELSRRIDTQKTSIDGVEERLKHSVQEVSESVASLKCELEEEKRDRRLALEKILQEIREDREESQQTTDTLTVLLEKTVGRLDEMERVEF